jgi:acyl-CoA thioester hydrolase
MSFCAAGRGRSKFFTRCSFIKIDELSGCGLAGEKVLTKSSPARRTPQETGMADGPLQGETQIRVRYAETDRMGLLHHANYLVYFEQARTDLLRQQGATYRELEDAGFFLVVTQIAVKYKRPAHYDDVLTIRTTVTRTSPVRLEHRYDVFDPAGQLTAEGTSTLACVDKSGRLQAMPQWLVAAK